MSWAAMVLALTVCAAVALAAAPAADLSGTWLGVTQVPDLGEDQIKLVLKADGQSYTGLCTDSAGIVVPSPITNVKVEGALLTFDISVNTGGGAMPVHISLKADGDTLAGGWATDDGGTGGMTLTRQK